MSRLCPPKSLADARATKPGIVGVARGGGKGGRTGDMERHPSQLICRAFQSSSISAGFLQYWSDFLREAQPIHVRKNAAATFLTFCLVLEVFDNYQDDVKSGEKRAADRVLDLEQPT